MSIDASVVQHIAHLARLHVTAAESDEFAGQLSKILGYIDQLQELDVEGVEPFIHPVEASNVFRDDKAEQSYPREEMLKNAAEQSGNFFVIPNVMD